MLGLTTPDAIAFGSLCAALLAACAGMLRSEHRGKDPDQAADSPAPAQDEALVSLAAAITDLAVAIRAATLAEAARDQYSDMIGAILRRLDERAHNLTR